MKTQKTTQLRVPFKRKCDGNGFCPKKSENFFESGFFTMGRSGYLKHKYFFSRPYMYDGKNTRI